MAARRNVAKTDDARHLAKQRDACSDQYWRVITNRSCVSVLKSLLTKRFFRRRGPNLALSLASLPHHLDKNFSGLCRIAHFSQECDPSTLRAILGFQAQVEA
jgi:hypothetical protein